MIHPKRRIINLILMFGAIYQSQTQIWNLIHLSKTSLGIEDMPLFILAAIGGLTLGIVSDHHLEQMKG